MGASAGTVEETAGSVAGTGSPLVLEVESKVKGTVCSQLSDTPSLYGFVHGSIKNKSSKKRSIFFLVGLLKMRIFMTSAFKKRLFSDIPVSRSSWVFSSQPRYKLQMSVFIVWYHFSQYYVHAGFLASYLWKSFPLVTLAGLPLSLSEKQSIITLQITKCS